MGNGGQFGLLPECGNDVRGTVAQLVEHRTFNARVIGATPIRPNC